MEYQKNQTVVVKIEDMSTNGEGIGKINGYTLFVKDAIIGDEIEASLTKVKKNYSYARVKRVITPSEKRINPPCPISRQCGGCQIQALNYESQLEYKNNIVRNNLIRLGGFEAEYIDSIMEPIVGMEEEDGLYDACCDADNVGTEDGFDHSKEDTRQGEKFLGFHYRNKAQYPIGSDKDGNPIAGFYASRTHSIIPNTECKLGVTENKVILDTILDHMKKYGIKPYDEETGKGLIRHVLIRKGFDSKEIMVCFVINRDKAGENGEWIKKENILIDELVKIDGMASISVCVNTMKNNVIMGDKTYTLWGKDTITDKLHIRDVENKFERIKDEENQEIGLKFNISPLSFYQVNPIQTEKLYSQALHYAGLNGKETVWDLYCGIGTISLFMSKKAKKVYGVEIIPEAIADAKENARINGIENAEFVVSKSEDIKEGDFDRPDVIMVDPPRKGCDEECLNTILKVEPDRVVYVSCDSATLARDLKKLS